MDGKKWKGRLARLVARLEAIKFYIIYTVYYGEVNNSCNNKKCIIS
jgi:hypothetical protein